MIPGIMSAGVFRHYDQAGSQTFTSSGTFTVPSYAGTLVIKAWGAGGGGYGSSEGFDGGNTTITGSGFSTLNAGGGKRANGDVGGAGGTASGGDINTTGGSGGHGDDVAGTGAGGNAPGGGGTGGTLPASTGDGNNGNAPGGGGSGARNSSTRWRAGGGAGAYLQKTYTTDQIQADKVLTITIGNGGNGGSGSGSNRGGNGARGEVQITWT